MAEAKQGALSTVKSLKVPAVKGLATDADDAVETAMQRVMDAYTARQQRNYDPGLMAIAQGLLSSRGNFGEAAGMAAKNYQDVQTQLRQEDIDTAQAELQLEQSRREQMLVRRKMEQSKELFGGATPGVFQGSTDGVVDQDALTAFTDMGMPEADARMMLAVQSAPATPASAGGMDMNRLQKYIFTNGYEENAKAAMEMLKLQNDRYAIQNGMRMEKATGKVDFVQPTGLPQPAEKNIELFIGGETRMADQRTAMLYEFAQSQGPEAAQEFAKSYKEKGIVPEKFVKMFNSQKTAGPSSADGEPLTEPQLKIALSGIMLKNSASLDGSIDGALPLDNKDAAKAVTYSPLEKKVITSFGRLLSVPPEKWTLRDKQVFEATKKEPISLEQGAEPVVDKAPVAAARPAEQPAKVAAVAPAPAAAPVPAVKAAAVVPSAKAAAVSEAPAAAPAGLKQPAPPKVFSPAPLPPNPSAEAKLKYETEKAAAEAKTRADVERYKIEMEQYNKDLNRPKDVEAAIEEAVQKKRGELAEVDEQTFVKALDTSRQIKSASLRVMKNVIQNPSAIGMLADPGLFNAVGSLVADGISLGTTTVKLADAEGALAKVIPGITKQDLQSRSEIAKDLAEIELLYRREFLAGLGTVTDSEGRVVQRLGGTPSDNPTVLIRRMELITSKAKYKEDKVKAFRKWRANKNNKSLSINDWLASDEAIRMDENYDKTTDALYDKFFGAPATKTSEGAAVVPQLKNAKQALSDLLKGK
jgi:hypothetical protein